MKLVVALVFLFNGQIDHEKTIYFEEVDACRWYAQNYSRERPHFEPTECVCKLAWVDRKAKVLK